MHSYVKRIIFLSASTLLVASSSIAQTVAACNAGGGNLTPVTPDVTFDNPHFDVDRSMFPIEVFSLAGATLWASSVICLRYEIENVGTRPIPLLYWKLIAERTTADLLPQTRVTRVLRRLSVTRDAIRAPTQIRAFRAEELTSVAWQALEDAPTKKAAIDGLPAFHFERAANLDPDVAAAVADRQIPDADVAVIDPLVDPLALPPLVSDALRGLFGDLETSSLVYKAGPASALTPIRYGTQTSVMLTKHDNNTVSVYAPALVAMDSRDTRTTADFLRSLKSSRRPISRIEEKGEYSVFNLGDQPAPRLYVIEHPVTIKWKEAGKEVSTCIKVSSYSRFPVSVGDDYCM
jgi:hypothetical protein